MTADTAPAAAAASSPAAPRRVSLPYCQPCGMSGAHPEGEHGEFTVTGTWSYDPRFALDVRKAIAEAPNDWHRAADQHPGDFEEAVNAFVVDLVADDADGMGFIGGGALHWNTLGEPDIDWRMPDGALARLEAALAADGLWDDGADPADRPEPPVVNCPGQTSLDL